MPKIYDEERIGEGRWIVLDLVKYSDRFGADRDWEVARRVNAAGAVGIIATLKPSNAMIFIRQYRVPMDAYVIECPAGLVDHGETVETTAVRELYEETGYSGSITKTLPPVCSSPGFTDEVIALVLMEVDENAPENQNVVPALEPGEDIETIIVQENDLESFISAAIARGDRVDAKIMSWLIAKLGW